MDAFVFLVSAAIVLTGAVGVLTSRNPVHAALFLVQTLFGVAVLFVLQDATFLAAVQVIVYAGAVVIGASLMGLLLTLLLVATDGPTGAPGRTAPLGDAGDNTRRLGEALFTGHVFAVELTALLLTVAVVGAVVLARTVKGPLQPLPVVVVATATEPDEPADEGAEEEAEEEAKEEGSA